MQRPKLEKKYTFVLINNNEVVDWLHFKAYKDGSGGIDPYSEREFRELEKTMEITPLILKHGSWKNDWDKLQKSDWIELNEAKQRGLVHADWEPD